MKNRPTRIAVYDGKHFKHPHDTSSPYRKCYNYRQSEHSKPVIKKDLDLMAIIAAKCNQKAKHKGL